MFKEITRSFKAALYEKTTSPLFASIILFWCYFNWRIVLIIFFGANDNDIEGKMLAIENNHIDIWKNVYLPIIWALSVSIVYPFVSILPYSCARVANIAKIKLRNWADGITTISKEEFVKLKKDMIEREIQFTDELEKKSLKEKNNEEKLNKCDAELSNITVQLNQYKTDEVNFNEISHAGYSQAKKDLLSIIAELEKQLNNGFSPSFAYFTRNLPQNLIHKDHAREKILIDWLNSIKSRLSKNSVTDIVSEVGDFLFNLYDMAESIRENVKSADSATFGNNKGKAVEEWSSVRESMNRILNKWKQFIESDYIVSDKIKIKAVIKHLPLIDNRDI